ncbi:MAG: XdhC family protein, partial [Candidatus Hydrothermae bacterium]|nr:XdhC family protein [Candidatus Hydrothermae bacterium]
MRRVFEEALRAMESGRASALVLLTKKEGSSARDPGAMMLVLEDGSTVDTVGGGILEERLKEEALNAIRDGKTRNISFALDETSKGDLNLYCGGKVEFAVIPLYPQEK